MIKFKICLLGPSGVGKSSLATRLSKGTFSDSYARTVGVRIEKKALTVDDRQYGLIIWDMAAHDRYDSLNLSYLQDASGFLCVLDCTCNHSLVQAYNQLRDMKVRVPGVPTIVVINKMDLEADWDLQSPEFREIMMHYPVLYASAKNDVVVDRPFRLLIEEIRKSAQYLQCPNYE